MYWSFILLGGGILLLTANWLLGGGFLLIIFNVMFIRTPTEERALQQAYGDERISSVHKTYWKFPEIWSLQNI